MITDEMREAAARALCPKNADGTPYRPRWPSALADADAALDAVYPMIREAVLREAAAHLYADALRLEKADLPNAARVVHAEERALLALAQQGAQGREDGR